MKKMFYFVVISLLVVACNNNQDEIENTKTIGLHINSLSEGEGAPEDGEETFVPIENNIGQIHNEGLMRLFAELDITSTDNFDDLIQEAVRITNENIRVQAGEDAYAQAQEIIIKDRYIELKPELIRAEMTDKEGAIFDEIINAVFIQEEEVLSQIKSEIIEDEELSNEDKQRYFDMIDVAEHSYLFWTEEIEPPIDITPEGLSVRNQQIVAADCIWFWAGGMASGLNPVVAGGASLVGSFAAWLNGR